MIKLKRILTEGRYGSEVSYQSRYIVNQFKNALESGKSMKFEDEGSIPSSYRMYDGELEETEDGMIYYDLIVKFLPSNATKLGGSAYDIEAEADEDTMILKIQFNPAAFPQYMNDFIAELKETLRHELEHIAQYNLIGKEEYEADAGVPFYRYLLLNHEVPAFVRGLYQKAKTKRIPLSQAIEDFFDDYIDSFNSPGEIEKVRRAWTAYAQKHIPNYR